MELFKKYFVNIVTKKYIAFEGTAGREEFWYFTLFAAIISLVLGLIFAFLAGLFNLAILLPWLSVAARRLRNAGHSPWWLLSLIFGIGIFYSAFLMRFAEQKSFKITKFKLLKRRLLKAAFLL